jgi:uncharacterized protein YbjT (DUF2867 family)
MYAVLGASGHVGSAVVDALRTAGEDVVAVVRSSMGATALQGFDVEIRAIDVLDTDGLRNVFKQAQRAFLLNPPADPSVDTDAAFGRPHLPLRRLPIRRISRPPSADVRRQIAPACSMTVSLASGDIRLFVLRLIYIPIL